MFFCILPSHNTVRNINCILWLADCFVFHGYWCRNSCLDLCLPLQVANGNGSPWMRPSKCCKVTNRCTLSTCGGSSSAAPPPTGTPSSPAPNPTTTSPTTAPRPTRHQRGVCWAPPADRTAHPPSLCSATAGQFTWNSVQSCMVPMTFFFFFFGVSTHLYVSFLVLAAGQTKAIERAVIKTRVNAGGAHGSDRNTVWMADTEGHVSFCFCLHQTDELKKRKKTVQVWLTWWRIAL